MKRYRFFVVLAAAVAALAVPILARAIDVTWSPMVASQRFEWQQPLPQGNPIKAVDFVTDTLGWAIGDNGVVLKTTTGGLSWINQGLIVPQGSQAWADTATDVDFVDANNGWIAIGPHVYRTTNGGTTWTPTSAWIVQANGQNYFYQSVDFADANNGWFIGSYQMFHTTNGGSTVTSQTLPAGATPFSVKAANSADAFAYAYFQEGYLSTSDGGTTWNQRHFTGTAHEGDGPDMMAVCSGLTQYAAVNGDLLETISGGSTWTTVTVNSASPGDYIYQVWVPDGDTSGNTVYVSIDGHGLHKSINGGANWTQIATNFNATDMDVPSAATLFKVDGSRVRGSSSSGTSWYDCFGSESASPYTAVDFTSETTGHALTPWEYARTSNGGATWTVKTMAEEGIALSQMNDMTFLDGNPDVGWIVGTPDGGSGLPSVYKTVDGGSTWQAQEETRMVSVRRVRFSDANNGWAIDPYYFRFWHSSDGGNTWQQVAYPSGYGFWDIDFVDANNGWIPYSPPLSSLGMTVAHTTDGGSTWTTQTVGNTGGTLQNIDFVDASTGYAVDTFANIFKTTNGGDTWTEIHFWPWAPDFRINDIKFTTALDGWVVGKQQSSELIPQDRHDFAAHTTDGGMTWDFYADAAAADKGSTGTNVGITAIETFGDDAWLGGGFGTILKYRQRSVAAITSTAKTLSSYRQSTALTGSLKLKGAPLGGKRVELWTADSPTGTFTKSSATAITNSGGAFSLPVAPYSTTYYRVKFAGDATARSSALSGYVRVTPAPYVGTPHAPTTMSHSKYYAVDGYLKPRHTAGGYPVRIYRWKKTASGAWKPYGYVKAKASNYSSYTKYSVRMKLTTKGKWRVRGYAPADGGHAACWSSGYDYVTVN